MNAGPPAPPRRRSKRDAGSATAASADRRKRATTVSPARLVKLTKKRRLDAACGGSARPSPPVVGNPPPAPETINGTERIGWDQPAADAAELATIRYVMYVDGARTELTGVSCGSTAAANGFACTARLPSLTAG